MRILKWDFDCVELGAGWPAGEDSPFALSNLSAFPAMGESFLPLELPRQPRKATLRQSPRGLSFEASNHNCKSACPRFTYLSHLIVQDSTYGAKALIPNIPSIPWHLSRALAG